MQLWMFGSALDWFNSASGCRFRCRLYVQSITGRLILDTASQQDTSLDSLVDDCTAAGIVCARRTVVLVDIATVIEKERYTRADVVVFLFSIWVRKDSAHRLSFFFQFEGGEGMPHQIGPALELPRHLSLCIVLPTQACGVALACRSSGLLEWSRDPRKAPHGAEICQGIGMPWGGFGAAPL